MVKDRRRLVKGGGGVGEAVWLAKTVIKMLSTHRVVPFGSNGTISQDMMATEMPAGGEKSLYQKPVHIGDADAVFSGKFSSGA